MCLYLLLAIEDLLQIVPLLALLLLGLVAAAKRDQSSQIIPEFSPGQIARPLAPRPTLNNRRCLELEAE